MTTNPTCLRCMESLSGTLEERFCGNDCEIDYLSEIASHVASGDAESMREARRLAAAWSARYWSPLDPPALDWDASRPLQ